MKKKLIAILGAAMLLLFLATVSVSQVQTTTVTKVQTVQNADGTYTIVEYPVGKTTVVTLNPVGLNGVGTFTTTTPLSKFMLVTSSEGDLTAYTPSTHVYFRSAVPAGLAVIPLTNAVGETIGAIALPTEAAIVPMTDVAATADYTVPMLGIPTFKR